MSLRDVVAQLGTSAHALAAIAAALDARLEGVTLDARLAAQIDEVVSLLGVTEAIAEATPAELAPLLGEIRTFALLDAKLMFAASRRAGWQHDERALLDAAGEVSTAFPDVLANAIAPALDGLLDRLTRPGAAFLDVGIGVAAMSIEMVRRFPHLRVVGLDPWAPALALARERVHAAGLDDRIELRHEDARELSERDAFDLAWIPSGFIPERALPPIVARVHAALRPGGWLLFPILRPDGDALTSSTVRLRVAMLGGVAMAPERAHSLLRESFATVRTLPSPPNALTAMVAAQRH